MDPALFMINSGGSGVMRVGTDSNKIWVDYDI